jgi:hypothetical protein
VTNPERHLHQIPLGVVSRQFSVSTPTLEKCLLNLELTSVNKILLIGVLFLGADSLLGSLIYNTPAAMSGTRSVGNGLTNGGGNGYNDLLLTWSIAEKANGTFDYSYVISGFVSPALGHAIIELGADCIKNVSANCVTNAKVGSPEATTPAAFALGDWCYGASGNPGVHCQGKSNVGLPKDIVGAEFTNLPGSTTVIITFNSTRAPVWGDFYLMGGQQYVYNQGNGKHAIDSNPLDFIARPDPAGADPISETPEPGSFGLAGAALALLGARVRWRPK